MIRLLDFTTEDYEKLHDFMRPLWLATYGGILPTAQIEFLLEKYFSKAGLAHYRAQGYRYRKIGDNGVLVTVEKDGEIYIDKLYLLPSARGKGIPTEVFKELHIFLSVSVQHCQKFALDFLFQSLSYSLELSVMLQHFS